MSDFEIKNKLDTLLMQLATEKSLDAAEKVVSGLVGLLGVVATDRFLLNIPRVDAELSRFQLAPGFARQAAAYELPHEDGKPFDLKLFWIKKVSKTNLSWLIGLTPNFEDALSNDYKNIGIDFVVPESCDYVIILLSNKFKVRALELKDHITPTQLEIFSQWSKLSEIEFADQNELKSNLHAKLWESFNFEPINRKFYLGLVEHFSILVHHLEKEFDRKPSVMFTTRLIGRLLFIWFLKKKNLVNVEANYFSVLDPEKQKEYYENKLEKLFFEVLNRDILERDGVDKMTPYLNGGLFDRSATDFYSDPKLTFPSGYFNQLFETLNKYNFTVDESSPEFQHVAIDPEMLGRIFESLLAEQIDENTGNSKKKATGAFYTPREIVSYMCEQSLIEYLKTKISDTLDRDRRIDELVRMPEAIFRDQDQNKRRDWKPYRDSIIQALEGTKTESPLTVLDPAVGSGAFPMGMLHLLVKVYSRLDPKFEKDISGLKRAILSRSLYGVDIEQTAIEITRLRAWLSIIVDIPEGERVEPLPNLDFKFVCANTLIPLDNSRQETFFTDHDLKDKLIAIRDDYFRTSSKIKKEKLQKDYLKLTQGVSLFDNKKTQQLKSYKPFDISSSSEFYDPELMHGVESFNIILGNPPYGIIYDTKIKEVYSKKYAVFQRNNDIYAAFYQNAINLLDINGVLSYISPNTFLNGDYFKELRKHLTKETKILEIIDYKELPVFADPTVFVCILFCKKERELSFPYTFKLEVKEVLTEQTITWVEMCESSDAKFKPKNEIFSRIINLKGVVVLDALFFIKDVGFNYWTKGSGKKRGGNSIGDRVLYSGKKIDPTDTPFIKGRDIEKYCIGAPSNYLRHNYNDYLNSKVDTFRFSEVFFKIVPKIVYRQTANRIIAALDFNSNYIDKTVHLITPKKETVLDLRYVLAILNSSLVDYFYKYISQETEGRAFSQVKTTYVKQIPIVEGSKEVREKIIGLVDEISDRKKNNPDADSKDVESRIDILVYRLYGLSKEEIKIIEGN